MLSSLKSWWSHPFKESMSGFDWLLFMGFLVAALAFWKLIINQITREVE